MTSRNLEKIMKKISVTDFRKRCLEFVDIVAATREPLVITRSGKPVAKLVP
jgi:prevent-host-death family protein